MTQSPVRKKTKLVLANGNSVERHQTAGFVVACAHCGAELDLQGLTLSLLSAMAASVPVALTNHDGALLGSEGFRPREQEVLQLLAAGWRVTTIAERLGITHNTVRKHLQRVYKKVGVSSQAGLVEWLHAMSRQHLS